MFSFADDVFDKNGYINDYGAKITIISKNS